MRKVEFQRRHFQFIADELGEALTYIPVAGVRENVLAVFSHGLRETNANFDRERFEKAVNAAYDRLKC